ncbi:hypothetical protein D7V97_12480 [Corallococcus sp. CA053C]|nr:CocE/NonD family hydrolase [Corallococcus sp. CA053C]RKH10945.1 hypothetical protein D7V97_12480 [Corallococcus sp. CA053C]
MGRGQSAPPLFVARWVADQPWCTGHLGAVGISYKGTTEELLAVVGPGLF